MTALAPTGRVIEASARVYRRTFRGSVMSTFLNPVLFLLAMGVGLGKLVDSGAGGSTLPVDYLTFLAPGLLASTAMTTAAGDASFPVMAGIKWRKTYDAILATPVGVGDLVAGHLGWIALRLTFVTLVYAGVMTAFGATSVVEGLLAVPPAVLTGIAVAAVVTAYTARRLSRAFGTTPGFWLGLQADYDTEEVSALLKIMALGNRQIEEGKVQPAAEASKRLRKQNAGS